MSKRTSVFAACIAVLCAGAALAAPTPQQKCDNARITTWKKYQACVDHVIAKDAKGTMFDEYAAFAKCRHKYFGKWTAFQSYIGSTCVGARFTDNGDQTVTDNLSGLVWEKKANHNSTPNASDPHDADNLYTWSTGVPENGTAFSSFLGDAVTGLKVTGFAGASGWRLPTLTELQTITLDFECKGDGFTPTCTCPSTTCIDPALDVANTEAVYWSSTTWAVNPLGAWLVTSSSGYPLAVSKTDNRSVRAVRGGF